jgi:hypothetical protein
MQSGMRISLRWQSRIANPADTASANDPNLGIALE